MFERLALGTAQFGLDYGIANQAGLVSQPQVEAILSAARVQGLNTLDTAIAYGQSEQALGNVGVCGWRIVSKLPAVPDDVRNVGTWVQGQINSSIARLRVPKLYAALLHCPSQLLGKHGEALYDALHQLKTDGQVVKVGVSVYSPSELDQLFKKMHFDIVQAPLSIIDRRMVESGWAERLHSLGLELHVRSVFLQGLLIMKSADRPKKFDRWGALWSQWEEWLTCHGLSPLEACLRYVMSVREANRIVVGVDHVNQLQEIFASVKGELPPPPQWSKPVEEILINPGRWSQL